MDYTPNFYTPTNSSDMDYCPSYFNPNEPKYPHHTSPIDPSYPHDPTEPNYSHYTNPLDPNYPHDPTEPNYPHYTNLLDPYYPHDPTEPTYPHHNNPLDPNYPHDPTEPSYPRHPQSKPSNPHPDPCEPNAQRALQGVEPRSLWSGTRASAPGRSSTGRRAEGESVRAHTTTSAADCSCTRIGADSPAARANSPVMQRAGAGHPDADDETPSTSRGPDAATLYAALNEYLLLEHKFQPRLCLPQHSESGEVTVGARDGAAHVLRCLKVCYDLPCDVLLTAISLLDRFLTKMKVRPCHVPCITVSCMNIAIDQYAEETRTARTVSVEELVSVSQSACTPGDVTRMSRVISDKLCAPGGKALTALHWLRLLRAIVELAAAQLQLPPVVEESELINLLEIAACDATCANARLSELALVLLYYKLEQQMVGWSSAGSVSEQAYCLFDLGAQLQAHCRMSDASLVRTRARVTQVVSRYDARVAAPTRQRLVWKLSSRTLKVLRPTDRLTSLLPTIEEQHFAVDASPPRNRSGSESSESEETSDWPRSPVLPVYCDN